MDDWTYCLKTLPKVSRTFALNISVLRGDLHRSILTAYLFCRTVDTVEDAAKLDPKIKTQLLIEFSRLIENRDHREKSLTAWVEECKIVDGAPNDLDLLQKISRVFNVFNSLPKNHQDQIIPSVSKMAKGMAFFQSRFQFGEITPLENIQDLEEYCYFVAGVVGEMLCNLFFQKLSYLPEAAKNIMRNNAVSFGLGLQMTNISKDIIADRNRGWSYIPKSVISEKGLTMDEFHSGASMDKNLLILEGLLKKTKGHLNDALKFTLAIPRTEIALRLFCIWPLWMAVKTVAVLHNNPVLLNSNAQVKISRSTVKRILFGTPFIAWSNNFLKYSFANIINDNAFLNPPAFDLEGLKSRLGKIPLDTVNPYT
ncbi:MAG: squalene/phytoene synthase [Nitrospina sp.]|nr:squalene/phytoene synthase [Nitrospina sp.]MDC0381266.1 squalene/phytoene synthase family protein [Nitrospinota bacterium]|tara:strand:- start:469 stop:1572 length:1104 start_codon:yes stop_codon:yes gene_type:complete